jgi:hypothetical protein
MGRGLVVLNMTPIRSTAGLLATAGLLLTLTACGEKRPEGGVRPAPPAATHTSQITSINDHRVYTTGGEMVLVPAVLPAAAHKMPGLKLIGTQSYGGGGAVNGGVNGGAGVILHAVCGDTPKYVVDQMGQTLESHGWKRTGLSYNATLADCSYQIDGWAVAISSFTENGVTTVTTQIEPIVPSNTPTR